jgi:RHS repeat-associated protein
LAAVSPDPYQLQIGTRIMPPLRRALLFLLFFLSLQVEIASATTQLTSFTLSGSHFVGGSTQQLTATITISRDPADNNYYCPPVSPSPSGVLMGNDCMSSGVVSVSFPVYSENIYSSSVPITLTATLGGASLTQSLTIDPMVPVYSASGSLVGGSAQFIPASISLNAPLRMDRCITGSFNGLPVQSDRPWACLPANSTGVSFNIISNGSLVASDTTATITATLGQTATATITVKPFQVFLTDVTPALQLNATPPEQGQGKVTLNAQPKNAMLVYLTQNPTSILNPISSASIPAAPAVPTANFTFTPLALGATNIKAIIQNTNITAQAPVEVLPGGEPDLGCGGFTGASNTSNPDPGGIDATFCAGSPVNLTNGNTWISHSDYSIPGLGGGLGLTRTWNSLWSNNQPVELVGLFGNSWRSNFEERLQGLAGGGIRYWSHNGASWTFDYDSINQIYYLVSPANLRAALTVDSISGQKTVTYPNAERHVFDSNGYLIALGDRNNNQTMLTRDGSGRLTLVTSAGGQSLQFNYPNSASRLVSSVQDSTGIIANYSYDGSSRLTQVAYSDGGQYNYTYDANSLITSGTDATGKVLESHTYDSSRRGLTSANANGVNAVTFSYPVYGTTHLVDSANNATDYTYKIYAARHYITGVSGSGCATCTGGRPLARAYDTRGYLQSLADPANIPVSYTYDANGNFSSRSRQLDSTHTQTSRYTYNSFGQVLTATDPLGNTTTNTYDAKGNLLSVTSPAPDANTPASVTSFTYDSKGQLLTITDPLNHVTTLSYTTAGLIQGITDAQNNVTSYEYDAHGNRTAVVDAASNRTTFAYDAGDRLTTITYPGTPATTTSFGYDSRGRRTSVTDQNGKVTTYTYDDADRLTAVTDAANNLTQYTYDTENNLLSITDANNRTTSFNYDAFGRVTQTTFPSSLYENYVYDAIGNLTAKTDRKSQTINYVYDALNRLSHKGYPDSTGVDYIYDLVGKIKQVTDPTGSYGFAYDNMGRLIGTTTQYSFIPTKTFSMSYGYDKASNRASFTDAEGGVTSYVYDSLNRLQTLTPPTAISSGAFGFGYDNLNRRTSLTRPNGITTNYAYDSLSRLLSVLHQTAGSVTVDGAAYTYDNAGNRVSKTNYLDNSLDTYTYDNIYQLTQVTEAVNSNPAATTESYGYDAVGNRLSSLNVAQYNYNNSNHLNSSSDGVTYTYDNNGNTATKADSTGTTTYTWDYENRLASVALPGTGGTVTFKYDPFGRRIQKVSPTAGAINYLYDGANIVEEVNASGSSLARYSQNLGIDEPLAMLRGVSSFYQADGLGSITGLADGSGTSATTYKYDSFGNLSASTGSLANPFRYTGREWDEDGRQYYYRARYYDITAGRFTSEDPVRFLASHNFYSYVANDPILLIDPTGLKECCSKAEQNEIEHRADFLMQVIDDLRTSGTITGATGVGGQTICVVDAVRLPNGQLLYYPSYIIDIKIDQKKHPCLYECALMHEKVHERQCKTFGPTFRKLSQPEIEIPAYTMELGCLLRQMMEGHFGPYGSR